MITDSMEITDYEQDIYGMKFQKVREDSQIFEMKPHNFQINFALD